MKIKSEQGAHKKSLGNERHSVKRKNWCKKTEENKST